VQDTAVERVNIIRAVTPYRDKHHYIVVTPKVGGDFVQDGPIAASASGILAGPAVFGTAAVGDGQDFLVRIIATSQRLPPGELATRPTDAISSEPIVVSRGQRRPSP
jgi:hypothetical protein